MLLQLHYEDRPAFEDVFDQMFKLRARAFYERRKWSVEVSEGMETDDFDALNPLYLMVVEDGKLLASLRLLPTTGPHMLADIFPETMGEKAVLRHPLIWESTRFCVDTKAIEEHGANGVNWATSELLIGLFTVALEVGLQNVVSVYDLYMERIMRRAGLKFDRLGDPFEYDGLKTVAGVFEVSQEVVDRLISRQRGPDEFLPAFIASEGLKNAS